ncbi:MAG TPA: hypothetical protein VGX97_07135 [bacterium]|nr:hypothetical protein [bacterium]
MKTGASTRVLDAIGHTPLVEPRHVVPSRAARIAAQVESTNPTSSMKDRMARARPDVVRPSAERA